MIKANLSLNSHNVRSKQEITHFKKSNQKLILEEINQSNSHRKKLPHTGKNRKSLLQKKIGRPKSETAKHVLQFSCLTFSIGRSVAFGPTSSNPSCEFDDFSSSSTLLPETCFKAVGVVIAS